MAACSSQSRVQAPDAVTLLRAIPAADPGKYEKVQDTKNWRNPYLVIREDGVGLLDVADNAEIVLKPDELLAALGRLPAASWPYGRVVAAQENTVKTSGQDAAAIRRNRGIVGGVLQNAQIAVRWVPTS